MFSFSPDHINSPVAFTRKNANFSSGKSSSPVKSDYVMEGEVSPPKIFLKNIKDHSQLKNKKQEIARQKYELLISKISFLDTELPDDLRKYKYNFDGMLPYVFFFKYLARKPEFDNGSKVKNN